MAVRAVRGATQLDVDEREHLLDRSRELVATVLARNELTSDDLISIIFTCTPDLVSEFPAVAARSLGITDVPLLCARELDVGGAMPRVVRMMVHVDSDRTKAEMQHVYLHGTRSLRADLPHEHQPELNPSTKQPPA